MTPREFFHFNISKTYNRVSFCGGESAAPYVAYEILGILVGERSFRKEPDGTGEANRRA
ncbi:MAG TPA: hypothetical protein VET23_09510 [Chitinophagaceae bacterium]|nr:hypothetical protein [Chitinophagaceae bacterium]